MQIRDAPMHRRADSPFLLHRRSEGLNRAIHTDASAYCNFFSKNSEELPTFFKFYAECFEIMKYYRNVFNFYAEFFKILRQLGSFSIFYHNNSKKL